MTKVLVAAVALLASTAACLSAPPNIVVIMTDDQDDSGSVERMPALNELIKSKGVTFRNSFTDLPICGPSRVSFLTGQAAHNTGVTHNNSEYGGGYGGFKSREANSLAPWLKSAGYATGMVGKYINGWKDVHPLAASPGWDFWASSLKSRAYKYELFVNGAVQRYGSLPEDHQLDVLSRHALDFVRNARAPFFLWFNPKTPHTPVEPTPRHEGTLAHLKFDTPRNFNEQDISDKPAFMRQLPLLTDAEVREIRTMYRKRQEALLAVDDMIRDLVGALAERGQLDNTYIVFTSDNGWSQGSHHWPTKGLLYEECVRVPLIVRGPNVANGVQRDHLVNNLDLTATVLDWAGATAGNPLDGRSFRRLLGTSPPPPWRTALLLQGGLPGRNYAVQAVRTATRFYADTRTAGGEIETEYYNLAADPYQLQNRVAAAGAAVQELKHLLRHRLKNCVGSQCWVDAAAYQE